MSRITTNRAVQDEPAGWRSQETLDWLLEGDPAVRWQVMRDLLNEPERGYDQERLRVTEQGWGNKFLALQEVSGTWGGGIYSPKWISTTYTMLTLRRIGLHPENLQAQKGCQQLLEHGMYEDGGINYSKSSRQSEACITGMVLSILAYFRYPHAYLDEMAEHLLRRQMPDGGWNCRDFQGDTHSSFHTTISVLEGLLEYQKNRSTPKPEIEAARLNGHEFLLQHQLFRSHRTGEVVDVRMTRMPFPPRWYYDFLRALDYFQDHYRWRSRQVVDYADRDIEAQERRHQHDQRFEDAIQLLLRKQKSNGRWNMMRGPAGKTFFEMEPAGKASRWNTLRALRVLKWWDGEP